MRTQPLIAITADRTMIGRQASHVAGEKYFAAIVDISQALAMLLPAFGERQCVDDVLSVVDGLLLTGSYSNVEPHRYGGASSEPGTLHDTARDATTLPLIRAAIAAGVPVLGICRGLQEMNVAFGGSLHQNVHALAGFDDHRENKAAPLDTQYAASHPVALTRGGLLSRLAHGRDEARVNSLHGQGIARLGAGLTVEAVAADGLIEAIGVADAPAFALGVQWHPEWKPADDALSTAIFRAFGDACRQRMHARHHIAAAMPATLA
ncbi:gamma-glutamyl-gamma-aminobutyrate hydrolase family protein [Paraburkholderia antibiotica]|uniref:gamma-glutamyl-gamma-aminobutyrate hydrolase n=1 Tax=Paraburkholderia antibiotica TaxID=2728839 RepID=A0A7Y0A246_9BURK|nr:gamma-glutamyl-gamma-aminobutyrate hydrolase family protein [Paraburkholderia antibiotica]NML35111.1 gamma-glutamyl-gamma-aminobutyrate hydrolase family protein [Paraburkholderia antibiotica]